MNIAREHVQLEQPTEDTMIETKTQPWTLQSIYTKYSQESLWVNRTYQRKLVWTLEEKQALIDSILNGYPLPNILVAEKGTRFEIIDGLQRLHTIVSYIDNAFATKDGKYFAAKEFPTAQRRITKLGLQREEQEGDTITPEESSTFLDYTIPISIMTAPTSDTVNTVFNRINTYGHRLSSQERRQAGITSPFSSYIRTLSTVFRHDTSPETLELSEMPTISIEPAQQEHGYQISANQTYWGRNGITRGSDLRESLDEQCLAEIVIGILTTMPERSPKALDKYYQSGETESNEAKTISEELTKYGTHRLTAEIKHCMEYLEYTAKSVGKQHVRGLVGFKNSNSFTSFFALIVVALHRSLFGNSMVVNDINRLGEGLTDIYSGVDDRNKTKASEREKNISAIMKKIKQSLSPGNLPTNIYDADAHTTINNILRFSRTESASLELKQGILKLHADRQVDEGIFDKVFRTACGMANANYSVDDAVILIGVADSEGDAKRVKQLDHIEPLKVGSHFIVGCQREERILEVNSDQYFTMWRDRILEAHFSPELKKSLLDNMRYCDYEGYGILLLTITKQSGPSTYNNKYWERNSDQTGANAIDVTDPTRLSELFTRFTQRPK
jgi:hypothetical protein